MKKTTLLFAFVCAIIAAKAQPKALFLKYDHDFKEIKEIEGEVSTDFVVMNMGNKPLVFTEVKPSCGCTKPEWTTDSIMPGDSGFIRAKFDPTNLPGPFEKVIYVRTNGVPASMTLMFRGTVIPRPFEIEDKYPLQYGSLRLDNNFVSFGESFSGELDSAIVKVFNQGENDIWIKDVVNVPFYINFEMPSLRLKAKEESIIKVKFDTKASGQWGEKNYVFYLNTDDPESSNISIFANIHIREKFKKRSQKELQKAPKIEVDAQMLYLGKILKGDSITFQYTLTNMGKETLTIRSVNTLCGCTVSSVDKMTLKRGESTIVRGTFHSEGRDGDQEKYITIVSNDPVTPELRVGFRAEIVTNPNALKY